MSYVTNYRARVHRRAMGLSWDTVINDAYGAAKGYVTSKLPGQTSTAPATAAPTQIVQYQPPAQSSIPGWVWPVGIGLIAVIALRR